MRVLVQRVSEARVRVEGETVGAIKQGLLLFLGVHRDDGAAQASWLAGKVAGLRCFTDEAGKMNLSLADVGGGALVVSQFTLYGACDKGRRPDFGPTAPPELAEPLYVLFVRELQEQIGQVETGRFGAKMDVHLVNNGPVTFLIEH